MEGASNHHAVPASKMEVFGGGIIHHAVFFFFQKSRLLARRAAAGRVSSPVFREQFDVASNVYDNRISTRSRARSADLVPRGL